MILSPEQQAARIIAPPVAALASRKLDMRAIIKVRHTGTARHFDVAALTSYTTQARFGGCACVSQPAQLVEAGFVLGNEMIFICEQCGITFKRNKLRSQHHFCSQACAGAWKSEHTRPARKRIIVTCANCGAALERTPSRARGNAHFCDTKCRGAWDARHRIGERVANWKGGRMRKPIVCARCGKSAVSRADRNGQFCSRACAMLALTETQRGDKHPQWKGGYKEYYGPNWKAQRRAARKRDGYKCRICGKTQRKNGRALDVHHIRPFREFGYVPGANEHYKDANDLINLVSLCKSCHGKAEHGALALQLQLL